MDTEVIVALITGAAAIITAIITGVMALIKQFNKIMSEFRPNGGSSLKDQINKLERSHEKLEDRVDTIFEILTKKFGGK